jgi:ABC-type transport system substrate-binding protein
MPFFCAVPVSTPLRATLVAAAGPYYIARYVPNRTIVLRRNPYYRGPRPARLDEIDYRLGVDQNQSLLEVIRGSADYAVDGVPAAQQGVLRRKYGGRRLFVHPVLALSYIALNTSRPLFADVRLRRAVNLVVDRQAWVRQGGLGGGVATDQILPPGMPGFRDAHLYPLARPDVERAKRLAAGRGGTAVLYACDLPVCANRAELLRQELAQIGIKVNVRLLEPGVAYEKAATRGEPFDLYLGGWVADYGDPYDFLNVLVGGDTIRPSANTNLSYFRATEIDKRLAAAADSSGRRRYAAYAAIDADVMRRWAPIVPMANPSVVSFFSARIGCQVQQPVYGIDIGQLCIR